VSSPLSIQVSAADRFGAVGAVIFTEAGQPKAPMRPSFAYRADIPVVMIDHEAGVLIRDTLMAGKPVVRSTA
jgi:hypothetical protein